MSNEERGLLASVCADPEDDTARLVYADWLEEHGGRPERAEFIRVQIALAIWDCSFKQPGWKHNCGHDHNGYWLCQPLRSRVHELWAEHGWKWVELSILERWDVLPFGERIRWHRGFVESVACSAADWLAHADALYWHPEQTVLPHPCHCGSNLRQMQTDGPSGYYCPKCHLLYAGLPRDSRPCPETAQPITRVVLTTPGAFLRKDWPGITFALPDPTPSFTDVVGAIMTDLVLHSYGVPPQSG